MGEITLTTFLLQEVLCELRALLVVLVPLSGFGVLVGEKKGVWLFFGVFLCASKGILLSSYLPQLLVLFYSISLFFSSQTLMVFQEIVVL